MAEGNAAARRVRLFVGVTVRPSPAVADLLARLTGLGRAVRVSRVEQLHVTLKFLGDVDESVVKGLGNGIADALSQERAFDWRLRGTGAFPSASRPSVVWAGAHDGGRFASLAERIESAAGSLGFPREARAFHPHVTLARVKFRPPAALAAILAETATRELGPQRAEEVVLFRSDLGRNGSVYTPLRVVSLASS